MSDEVARSVPDQDPGQALLDLERFDSIDDDITAPFSLFRGPFGVSKLSQPSTDLIDREIDERLISTEDWVTGLDDVLEQVDSDLDNLAGLLDVPDNIPNPDSEIWDFISDPTPLYTPRPQTQISPSYFTDNAEAWSILSHYRDRIVPLISPLGQGQEQSWMNLVMPCAVHTLGELTMNGSATHARLALLNTLLSTSAFHLGNHSALCMEHWISVGNEYLQRARDHFIRCLEEATLSTMKKSKYKEILMAILSLSTTYVGTYFCEYLTQLTRVLLQMVKGDSEKRLSCLMQAERFICANGFKQSTLSPKRRALHHCYAYMRIMAETTSISSGLNMDITNASNILGEDLVDTDFRICPDIAFSDNILDMEKDPNVAQRDLHLAIPGRWSLTLFPKMYGVAESFLMLLSQVIRLANERDLSMVRNGREEMLNLKDFWIRAKALEKGIHLLLSSYSSDHNSTPTDEQTQTAITRPRAQAMYTALLIYFHRRIYDLDAAMLRQEVDTVRDSLVRIQQDEAGQGDGNTATLIWPAFIAACEAVSSEAQMFFSSWFDACFTMTGLTNASVAKQIIEIIWAKRREVGRYGGMCSWPEVLRAKNIRLMCT